MKKVKIDALNPEASRGQRADKVVLYNWQSITVDSLSYLLKAIVYPILANSTNPRIILKFPKHKEKV